MKRKEQELCREGVAYVTKKAITGGHARKMKIDLELTTKLIRESAKGVRGSAANPHTNHHVTDQKQLISK